MRVTLRAEGPVEIAHNVTCIYCYRTGTVTVQRANWNGPKVWFFTCKACGKTWAEEEVDDPPE
jgi:hypothetical protein